MSRLYLCRFRWLGGEFDNEKVQAMWIAWQQGRLEQDAELQGVRMMLEELQKKHSGYQIKADKALKDAAAAYAQLRNALDD